MPHYTEADLGSPTGIVISAEGLEKSGKTYSVLATAPTPLLYVNCDRDNRRVIKRLRATGRRIFTSGQYLFVPSPDQLHKEGQAKDDPILAANAQAANAIWKPVYRDWTEGLEDPEIRTVVVDSASVAYSVLRTKVFGKLTGVAEVLYAKTNFTWRELLMKSENSGKVVILIHRLRSEYKKEKNAQGKMESYKTGKLVAAGYGDTNFEVGAIVRHMAIEGGFRVKVMAEGVGRGDIKGLALDNEEIDYTTIVAKLTRTKREKWL